MKKSLVALAVLATAGAASAQSSVTLFGIVDAAVSYQTTTSRDPFGGDSVKNSQWSLRNSGASTSRLGFRGTEDLGGGLAASFWLETALGNDDGTGFSGFGRRSTVSLSGGFGEVRLGRDYTPTFNSDGAYDPFGINGSGSSLIYIVGGGTSVGATGNANTGAFGAGAGLNNINYARASNSIGYFLPPNLGGFYGQVQYAFHENVKSDYSLLTGLNTESKAGQYVGGRFGYANGPLDVSLAYGQSTAVDTAALTRKVKTASLGATYDFGVVKLFGEVSQVKNSFDTAVAATTFSDKYKGALVGVSVPVGAGLIRASYAQVKLDDGLVSSNDPKVKKFAIGYVHNLSKRTSLYATVARTQNTNNANYTGGLQSNYTTGYNGTAPAFGSNALGFLPKSATGYDFGIRHSF